MMKINLTLLPAHLTFGSLLQTSTSHSCASLQNLCTPHTFLKQLRIKGVSYYERKGVSFLER